MCLLSICAVTINEVTLAKRPLSFTHLSKFKLEMYGMGKTTREDECGVAVVQQGVLYMQTIPM